MTPLGVYKKYKIYRGLQDHQLRVAAIAVFLARRAGWGLDERLAALVCLFHDMGNIIKADLSLFPQLLEPEGLAYWLGVQKEFREKYGNDEHVATEKIARAIGLPEEVVVIMGTLRFSRTEWILKEGAMLHKVCKYADLRVAPLGILPLEERLAEARARYAGKSFDTKDAMSAALLERAQNACRAIEREVCSALSVAPEDITDKSIAPLVEELKSHSV